MVLLNLRAALAASVFAFCLLSCDQSPAGPEDLSAASCSDLTARFFKDSADQGHYRVVAPNGGQSYKVGDSVKVTLASGLGDGEALVQLDVTVNGSFKRGVLPGFPNKAVDTRDKCHLGFRIPDSLTVNSGRIALVSDSVRIRVAWYNHEDFQDFSDGYIKIGK